MIFPRNVTKPVEIGIIEMMRHVLGCDRVGSTGLQAIDCGVMRKREHIPVKLTRSQLRNSIQYVEDEQDIQDRRIGKSFSLIPNL